MSQESKSYHIYFNSDLGAVVMEWKGYSTSQQFKDGTELMLNTLIQHKASKVLADIKDMVIIGREDQDWLKESFIPRAVQFGFSRLAIVEPEHYFNRVAIETILDKIDKEKLSVGNFSTTTEATQWIANS